MTQIVCRVSGDLRENSNLDLNKFICDELQPNEEFNRLFNGAIDSLYRELQRELQHTKYGIHNLIKVGVETAFRHLLPKRRRLDKVLL